MNRSIIRYILCRVLQFVGAFMALPCIVGIIYKERDWLAFLVVGAALAALGTLGSRFKPKSTVFYAREGFVTVALSWILLSLGGAVPFVITGDIPNYIDAVFETVSGFTTTGASILTEVESMSKACMFWRCFTNWIGGMGVLVFIMSILPLSGSHNMHLMRAESTGADVGKLVPRVKNTAKILYSIYLGLSFILIICFLCAGMSLYDSLVIGFSTMGTGGFANLNSSLAGYSKSVQVIATVFMIMCGVNFNAYFLILMRKPGEVFKLEEVKAYLGILLVGTLLITFQIRGDYASFGAAFHDAIFQASSVMTTTGFSTVNYDLWPTFSKVIIVFLTIVGGCAGSTAGGIKISRFVLLLRSIKRELGHLTHPRSVHKIRLNGQIVQEETVKSVEAFIIAYLAVILGSFVLVSLDGFDLTSTFTAVLTAISNVGPGFGMVGPAGNFSEFSILSKIVLSLDMLAGRLEIFPLLVLLYSGFGKRK